MAHRATATNTGYDPRNPSVSPPAGVAENDIVIVGFTIDDSSATVSSLPSGFTTLESGSWGGDGAFYWVGWKRATASESTYTFTLNAGAGLRRWTCSASAFSGRSTGAGVITDSTAGASGAPTLTAANGDDLVYFDFVDCSSVGGVTAFAPPTDFTERADLVNAWAMHGTSTRDGVTSGATGTISGTESGSSYTTIEVLVAIAADGGDSTAPVLSSPTGTATGTSTATVGATTDEGNGTLYAVVTTSATQPSVAQIKAGQNHLGTTATWSGNQAISSTGAKTFSVTGLTTGTTYYAHFVHTDAATNNSAVSSTSGFVPGYVLSVTPVTLTPSPQSVSLILVGQLNYTLVINAPATVTPSTQVVALSLATPVSNLVVTPVTSNIVFSVTTPITRALCSPLTQSIALNASGQPNNYTLTVTPVSPTITPQDVALNPSYALSGSGTSYRQRRRVSYATRYFSRG